MLIERLLFAFGVVGMLSLGCMSRPHVRSEVYVDGKPSFGHVVCDEVSRCMEAAVEFCAPCAIGRTRTRKEITSVPRYDSWFGWSYHDRTRYSMLFECMKRKV
jgi:hypothetical protein